MDRTMEFTSILTLESEQFIDPLLKPSKKSSKRSLRKIDQESDSLEKGSGYDLLEDESDVFEGNSEISKRINSLIFQTQNLSTSIKKLKKKIKSKSPFEDDELSIQALIISLKDTISSIDSEIQNLDQEIHQNSKNKQEKKHYQEILSSLQSVLLYCNKLFLDLLKKRGKQIKKARKRQKKIILNKNDRQYFDSMKDMLTPIKSSENLLLHHSPENVFSKAISKTKKKTKSENNLGESDLESITIENSTVQNFVQPQRRDTGSLIGHEIIEIEEIDHNDLEEDNKNDIEIDIQRLEQLELEENYQRTDEVEKIAKDVKQLSDMLNRLATMVVKHKELTQRIDENIEDADHNVHKTQKELVKYHNKVGSNRGLILKVFAILILFVFFVGFFIIK